jgi:hypothetical protein
LSEKSRIFVRVGQLTASAGEKMTNLDRLYGDMAQAIAQEMSKTELSTLENLFQQIDADQQIRFASTVTGLLIQSFEQSLKNKKPTKVYSSEMKELVKSAFEIPLRGTSQKIDQMFQSLAPLHKVNEKDMAKIRKRFERNFLVNLFNFVTREYSKGQLTALAEMNQNETYKKFLRIIDVVGLKVESNKERYIIPLKKLSKKERKEVERAFKAIEKLSFAL